MQKMNVGAGVPCGMGSCESFVDDLRITGQRDSVLLIRANEYVPIGKHRDYVNACQIFF
jgi:hypothetical protein